MKKEYFQTELNRIKTDFIRKSTEIILDQLPDYFYEIPACLSGKHHPEFAQGEQGLVRHVKVASRILESILENKTFGDFTPYEQDLFRMAVLLHDGFKAGYNYTGNIEFDHPLLMSKYLWENQNKLPLPRADVCRLCRLVECHMGPFNISKDGQSSLPIPDKDDEKIVHYSDYFASLDYINVEFLDGEIVERKDKPIQPVLKQK